jgi:hypothetical protein
MTCMELDGLATRMWEEPKYRIVGAAAGVAKAGVEAAAAYVLSRHYNYAAHDVFTWLFGSELVSDSILMLVSFPL